MRLYATPRVVVGFSFVLAEIVLLPPLAEQKRIITKVVELLSQCDQLESLLDRKRGLTTKLLSALIDQIENARQCEDLQMSSADDHKWSDEELKKFLSYSLRHVVGFALTYHLKKETTRKFICFSAFVLFIQNRWWLVTAGHIFKYWKQAINSGDVVVVGRALADYFGTDVTFDHPLPFDLFDQDAIHIFDKTRKLDFALVPLNDLIRQGLEKNCVMPMEINWGRKGLDDFDAYGVVGFPEEYSGPIDAIEQASGQVRPVYVPLQLQDVPTPDDQFPRFIAKIKDMGNQKSIVGMSGGPIFGYRKREDEIEYEIVAIQSTWNERDTIHGCPLNVVFALINAALPNVTSGDS